MSTKVEATDTLIPLLDALELLFTPESFVAMRAGTSSDKEKASIRKIDAALKASPGLSKPVTLYKGYEGFPKLRDGGELTEKAFFVGSTVQPDPGDHVTVTVTVPAGTPALRLNDDTYTLDRGLTLSLHPAKIGLVSATMLPATVAPGIRLTGERGTVLPLDRADGDWGTVVVEEFFNPFHGRDGRFGSGKGGGKTETRTPEEQARRNRTIKIVAGIAAAVIVVTAVGLILSGHRSPTTQEIVKPVTHDEPEKTKSFVDKVADSAHSLPDKKPHKGPVDVIDVLDLAQDKTRHRDPSERTAVAEYITISNGINGFLRGQSKSSPRIEADIAGLDRAFGSSSVETQWVTLHRGLGNEIGLDERGKIKIIRPKFEVGQVIQDNGFVSTSTSDHIAKEFTGSSGTVLRIKTQSGTKAISGQRGENELILNRGTAMTITAVHTDENNITIYDAEVI